MWFPGRRRPVPKRPPPPCPECGKPTSIAGRFCRACGWDADLEGADDGYLDGVDLPSGYGGSPWEDPPPRGRRLFILVAAILALVSFLWAVIS